MSVTVTEKSIKNKVKIGEKIAVVENIKYPYFESERYTILCKRMNEFYGRLRRSIQDMRKASFCGVSPENRVITHRRLPWE